MEGVFFCLLFSVFTTANEKTPHHAGFFTVWSVDYLRNNISLYFGSSQY